MYLQQVTCYITLRRWRETRHHNIVIINSYRDKFCFRPQTMPVRRTIGLRETKMYLSTFWLHQNLDTNSLSWWLQIRARREWITDHKEHIKSDRIMQSLYVICSSIIGQNVMTINKPFPVDQWIGEYISISLRNQYHYRVILCTWVQSLTVNDCTHHMITLLSKTHITRQFIVTDLRLFMSKVMAMK